MRKYACAMRMNDSTLIVAYCLLRHSASVPTMDATRCAEDNDDRKSKCADWRVKKKKTKIEWIGFRSKLVHSFVFPFPRWVVEKRKINIKIAATSLEVTSFRSSLFARTILLRFTLARSHTHTSLRLGLLPPSTCGVRSRRRQAFVMKSAAKSGWGWCDRVDKFSE